MPYMPGTASWNCWNEDVRSICGRFQTEVRGTRQSLRRRVVQHQALGLTHTSIETNARSVSRTKEDIREDGNCFFLVAQVRGRSLMLQGDNQAILNPGDMALVDAKKPCEFIHRGRIQHLSFRLRRSAVEDRFGSANVPTATRLSSEGPIGSLLAGLLKQIHSLSSELSMSPGEALETAIAALLVEVVKEEAKRPAGVDDSLDVIDLRVVQRYIDANLRNPSISPRAIARALGCSTRQVHRIFAQSRTTVSCYVKERRLEFCARELHDSVGRNQSVTAIAMNWGFSDASHFSRSFKRHFGQSPVEYRGARARGAGVESAAPVWVSTRP